MTSPFESNSEAYSPLYGNPNQLYTFNIILNSTAGANVTPTVWVVDSNNNTVYSGTGTQINDSGGTANGTSSATVNITQTGNWRYFWFAGT